MAKPSSFKAMVERKKGRSADEPKRERKFFSREISGSVTRKVKRMRSLRLFKFAKSIANLLSHISTRVYGTALLSFGLLSTLLYFIGVSADQSIATPIIGILLSCLAIPFLLADKPLPLLLQDFKPTDYLFFEFFCMKRHSALESERKFPISVALIIGFGSAAASVFIPLWQVALAIGVLIFVYVGMESPEFVFLTSLFCLPYIRFLPYAELIFALAVLLAVVSFIRKVAYGRRIFYFEQYDILLGIMLIIIFVSGAFSRDNSSLVTSVKMIVFSFGYFLAGNIITNRRLAELSASAIVLSGEVASIVSIIQLARAIFVSRGGLAIDLSGVLSRQDGVAAFLIVATLLSLGMIKRPHTLSRGLFIGASVLCFIGLALSGEIFAIAALFLCLAAHAVIKSNKLTTVLLPVLLVAVFSVFLAPADILNVVFRYSPFLPSVEELVEVWSKSAQLLINHIIFGIGMGGESFASQIAELGIQGFTDPFNILLGIGLGAGIFALITFLLILVTRLRHKSMYYLYVRNSQIAIMSNLSEVCLFGLLVFGGVNYIWSDASAYYLFWCIFGIGSASLRVAKRDYDDRVLYYEETSAHDSSVIDIEIG